MLYSDFAQLVDEVFGRAYGRTLVREQVLPRLGDRTPAEALDAGTDPRDVWHALCDALDVPDAERWGTDRHRQAPPAR
ncbi:MULTISPECIES: DUF3046 domain-containing protein [Isoptericola]|uniref:DUF3046 domain-containing protein n=1 Tax=Isoptericola sediminis TaxID=2733572 RepID=A0A849K721_9MICO|nr:MULTISPECIES: DUF3046 domain-containing protein [unclassified Isoptericola]MDO8144622.1 DUF3046 domain-containing protein [Isoptericola sp. 178]MDO8148467.1 DUF3046 domain-containing protein [Isoptericola sp. b515]MDO8151947.1 DUF3046 domain-containing protein [Isoptericola sp. b408]NNU28240.1 DUF3046 domain-containing protein [Isoptericola sediminis]